MLHIENGSINRHQAGGVLIPAVVPHGKGKKVHIGMKTTSGRIVSMCRNTRLAKSNAMDDLLFEDHPLITCKQCIAFAMNEQINTYELIMLKLHTLLLDGEALVTNVSTYGSPIYDPERLPIVQAAPSEPAKPLFKPTPTPAHNGTLFEKTTHMQDRVMHLLKGAETLELTTVEELLGVGTPEALELIAFLIRTEQAQLKEDCVVSII